MKQLICPISKERVNEQITRINAFIGIVLIILGFTFNFPVLFIFLLIDFFIRAFTRITYSPISCASHKIANALCLKEKKINKAPKIFAARLGFFMVLATVILYFAGLKIAALIIAGILVFFATLEFALAICVGCILYTYVILPFYKK
jgi:hypothetical protein